LIIVVFDWFVKWGIVDIIDNWVQLRRVDYECMQVNNGIRQIE